MILILIGIFLLLIIIGLPISFSMMISSILTLLIDGRFPLDVMVQRIIISLDSMSLLAVPLFLFAGGLMNTGGITERIMDFANNLVGHIKGGLCHVSILSCMIFAGVSGSSNADAAAISSIAVPSMLKEGYDKDVAISVVACGGTIGPIIPPSIPLIIYGSITSLSIGRLLLAGILPGILLGILLMAVSSLYAIKRNYSVRQHATFKDIWATFKKSILALLAPIFILAGITSGIFTATEAGAMAVLYCLIVSASYKQLSFKKLKEVLLYTVYSSAVVLFVISAGSLFGWILAIQQFPAVIYDFITNITVNPNGVMLIIIAIMMIVGFFIEGLAAMAILVPVFVPLIDFIGYDQLQFAIVFLLCISVGAITPPVGVVLFTVCGVTNNPLRSAGMTIYIFALGMLVATLIVAFVPQLSLFIPNLFL